jgi:hypothetical protein
VIIRTLLAALICASANVASAADAWIDQDQLVARTLILAPGEKERLIQLEAEGVLTIRPVALPRGTSLVGGNNHLGWPVGAAVGDALLCAYHRTFYHHGKGERRDAQSSEAVIVRSTDAGRTWSEPVDVRQFGKNAKPTVLGFGNCFGVLGDKVFLATAYGVYRSDDQGQSWVLLEGALTQEQTGHAYRDNFGPRMIIDPVRGLVIPVGVARAPQLDLYSSQDEGSTWKHERIQLSDTIHPLEPTAIHHDGHLIFLSRNHILPLRGQGSLKEDQPPVMMVSDTGWFPMRHKRLTNISSYRWPDTTDLDYNPLSKRFEAVVTNRNGGGPGNERNEEHEQTVNLWSISKPDLYAGRADKWRFEGTLLRLKSGMLKMEPDDIDAAHPGGAVIDLKGGVQHIFIYCGRYATPSGIFRISRTLETDRLRKATGG